ncbi:hypothetical protein D9M72_602890 [compost metagenome]
MQAAETGADDQHFAIQRLVEVRARYQQFRIGSGVIGGYGIGRAQEHGGLMKNAFMFFMKNNISNFIWLAPVCC